MSLIKALLLGIVLVVNQVWASAPAWTLTPVPGYSPAVSLSPLDITTIKYTVTNQSTKVHTLRMIDIQGIDASGCASPLSSHQSCVLTLEVVGNALSGDISGGPSLCEHGNPLQCYQPAIPNRLAIHLTQTPPPPPPVSQYTITPSAGVNGNISPSDAQTVNSGGTVSFSAIADSGFFVNQWLVDGNVVQNGGLSYQLTNITSNHTISVTFGEIQYTVTPSVGPNGSISPSNMQTINSGGTASFLATPDSGFVVDQWLLDGGVVQSGGLSYQLTNVTSNHTLQVTFGTTILTPDVSTLSLAINGNERQIVVQNTGTVAATNVTVSVPGIPIGTTLGGTCDGSTLNFTDTCIITISPGTNPSDNCGSTSPASPAMLTISAANGVSTQISIYVLTYGCLYQAGLIYAIDDTQGCTTTPCTGSIAGKAVGTVDLAPPSPIGIVWSSDGTGNTTADLTIILGIDETSTPSVPSPTTPTYPVGTPAFVPCEGNADGACDSSNIISYYNFNRLNGGITPTPLEFYPAGLCSEYAIDANGNSCTPGSVGCYTGWYVPAICEMGPDGLTPAGCGASIQNISNISGIIGSPCALGVGCLSGSYWSSTEYATTPDIVAWYENFAAVNGGSAITAKSERNGVRCVRAF